MHVTRVTSELKAYLQTISPLDLPSSLQKIILFGSYARGQAHIHSDIDLALVSTEGFCRRDRAMLRDKLDEFDEQIAISLFCTTEERLRYTDDPFDANYWIRREGIVLWQR